MRRLLAILMIGGYGSLLLPLSGCKQPDSTEPTAGEDDHGHDDHGHDGHGHGDDHAHGDDHDHDGGHAHEVKVPDTFPAAVEELGKMSASIADAYGKEDPNLAHDALHDIGHYLEALPELAKKAELSEEDQESVKASSESLLDAFQALDEVLHGLEGKSYDEVENDITSNMKTLRSMADQQP